MTWGDLRSGKDRVLAIADRASAKDAVVELIWNAIDAESTVVDVSLTRNRIGGATELIIRDNGHGIAPDELTNCFLTEGDSWKKDTRFSPNLKRLLHGKLGRGRLLVYGVADRVTWTTVAKTSSGNVQSVVKGNRSSPAGFEIGDGEATGDDTGTAVRLVLRDQQKSAQLGDEQFRDGILEALAESLLGADGGVSVIWDGNALNPEEHIVSRDEIVLANMDSALVDAYGTPELVVVDWASSRTGSRLLHLCTESGAALTTYKPELAVSAPGWSAYLKWNGFSDPELMSIADLHYPEFTHHDLLSQATAALNKHLTARMKLAKASLVRDWKAENVYPYSGEPENRIEEATREAFDVVAVLASGSIPTIDPAQKRLTLRLLKEALETEPNRLSRALRAVVNLEDDELEHLERLLDRTELGRIIQSASRVTDRLDFIDGLGALLHLDATRTRFREVDQLHPMLLHEPWVFGDEWDNCLSEHGLTRVVKAVVGAQRPDAVVSVEPVKLADDKSGRVDLLFHKAMPESQRDRHLVVELKRPGKLTGANYLQVLAYATAITGHAEVAKTATTWEFWLLGTEVADDIEVLRQNQETRGNFEAFSIKIVTWGELLDGLRRKYESYRQSLGVTPTTQSGLDYATRVHAEFLPEIEPAE